MTLPFGRVAGVRMSQELIRTPVTCPLDKTRGILQHVEDYLYVRFGCT